MSHFLFVNMTGPKVEQRIQVVFILLHEAKPVLGLFCLYLNRLKWSCDKYNAQRQLEGF